MIINFQTKKQTSEMSYLSLFGRRYTLNYDLARLIQQAMESENRFLKRLMKLILTNSEDDSDDSDDSSIVKPSKREDWCRAIHPEDGVRVYHGPRDKDFVYLSRFSIELVAQAILLDSDSILPYPLIDDDILEIYPLDEESFYTSLHRVEKKYLDLKTDKESDKFGYYSVIFDSSRKQELQLDHPLRDFIVAMLQNTGSLLTGSILLEAFGKKSYSELVIINSFTLRLLRHFINSRNLLGVSDISITFERYINYDDYTIKFLLKGEIFRICFQHLMNEDVDLSPEENRKRTIDWIESNYSSSDRAISYDGVSYLFDWEAVR